jgi:ribosome recycling factor
MSDKIINDIKKRMTGALSAYRHDLSGLRTGRASVNLLDSVTVEAYGDIVPLSQIGSVNVADSRMLSVQVWDQNLVKVIEKAIANSTLGLNPSSDGNLIRIPLPDLTEERRKELAKIAGQFAEKAKVSIRNVRRDGMDNLKKSEKNGDLSQDEQRDCEKEIQKITDDNVKEVDSLLKIREKEIMTT